MLIIIIITKILLQKYGPQVHGYIFSFVIYFS